MENNFTFWRGQILLKPQSQYQSRDNFRKHLNTLVDLPLL